MVTTVNFMLCIITTTTPPHTHTQITTPSFIKYSKHRTRNSSSFQSSFGLQVDSDSGQVP